MDPPQLYVTGLVGFFEDLARHTHGPLRGLKPRFLGKCGASAEKMSFVGMTAYAFSISC